MKRLFLSLLIALSALAFSQEAGPAGGAPRPGQDSGQKIRSLKSVRRVAEARKAALAKLTLTSDQKAKIEALDNKDRSAMLDVMKEVQKTKDVASARIKFRAIQENHRAEMSKILTKEQQKQFETNLKTELKKVREERGKAGGHPLL